MEDVLFIICDSKNDIKSLAELFSTNGLDVYTRKDDLGIDSLGPSIIITGTNIVITVINAIFSFLSSKQNKKIILKGAGGWTVEVPADISNDALEYYIKLASEKEIKEIIVTSK